MRQDYLKSLACLCLLVLFAGCATTEEYKAMPLASSQTTSPALPVKKEGTYHKVTRGQTLWQIAQSYGVGMKDIVDANNIPNGSALEVGQLLLIPGALKAKDVVAHPLDNNKNEFIWPLKGKVLVYFDDLIGPNTRSHGVDIQTQAGDRVIAAREGDVVLADYLSGWGQTVMLDHKDGFISVYARNVKLLVKLGDHVFKGDTIAEVGQMGSRVIEHFEVRHGSQATNPLYYLS